MKQDSMAVIAAVHTDFSSKFGLPRQSGAVPELKGEIVFEKEYRNPKAVEGLDAFSRIWVIWKFSENVREQWKASVRPPVLGGNTRIGVFATRSSFRPNPIGLSNLKLEGIEYTKDRGPVLHVSGIDMMDGTPVYDIKPYLPAFDAHEQESAGFTQSAPKQLLNVTASEPLLKILPEDKREPLIRVLEQDPRPSYQDDPERIYGFSYAGFEVRFRVDQQELEVTEIVPAGRK